MNCAACLEAIIAIPARMMAMNFYRRRTCEGFMATCIVAWRSGLID
jgi:hypothetical protein